MEDYLWSEVFDPAPEILGRSSNKSVFIRKTKFECEGFVISFMGLDSVPVGYLQPYQPPLRSGLDIHCIVEKKQTGNRGIDIGCGNIHQCFDARSRISFLMQSFYVSDRSGLIKCFILLRALMIFKDAKFVLALEDALFDAVLGRIVVITEPATFGSLREISQRCGPIPPAIVSALLRKLLDALIWLQWEQGFVHNGLTTYGIFVDSQGRLKLGGFQLSCKNREQINASDPELQIMTHGGDPTFAAPERILGLESSFASDVWSFGIIAHELCFHSHIFEGNTLQMKSDWSSGVKEFSEMFESLQGQDSQPFMERFENLDDLFPSCECCDEERQEAKDMVNLCLKHLPEDRSTVFQLRDHPFFQRYEKLGDDILIHWLNHRDNILPRSAFGRRKNLLRVNEAVIKAQEKRAMLSDAYRMRKDQRSVMDRAIANLSLDCSPGLMSTMKRAFEAYDTDGSGSISVPELYPVIKDIARKTGDTPMSLSQLRRALKALNLAGELSFEEFVHFWFSQVTLQFIKSLERF